MSFFQSADDSAEAKKFVCFGEGDILIFGIIRDETIATVFFEVAFPVEREDAGYYIKQ